MPTRHISISTATGTFPSTGWVDFGGEVLQHASFAGPTTANKGIAGTVQGSIGGAGVWNTILTLTTANSTGQVNTTVPATGADVVLFDKARIVVSTNNSTREFGAWLAGD